MNDEGDVVEKINNYDAISYNFGPTLLSWMDASVPGLSSALVSADKRSLERWGHGTAMAQIYHHAILPLCSVEDKETEVRWGVADFEHRYGRRPEGMWLSETAADVASLEALAAQGIVFTLLAPRQANKVRALDSKGAWSQVNERTIDTTQAYLCRLPSGRTINLFFYDGDLAMEVAFRGALNNGEAFAHQIVSRARGANPGALIHYATDGESYGHHHRYGEMALAYCIKTLQGFDDVQLCNYATYLTKNPPKFEVQIHQPSSWSCAHGVGRWSANCGCVIDPALAGKQEWRAILRDGLNRLRDRINEAFLAECADLVEDPFELRHRWLGASLKGTTDELIRELQKKKLSKIQRKSLVTWMEIQKYALMMFTSCGWFFDDPAGLEPVQILRYAARAIELFETHTGLDLQSSFVADIATMRSQSEKTPTGFEIWAGLVMKES